MRRYILPIVACAFFATYFAGDSRADQTPATTTADQPDGTVELTAGSLAAGIGYVWGHGHLIYNGRRHDFRISGLSIVDVGIAHITASGTVYNLRDLDDFNGNYTAATAGLTVGGGGSAAALRNANGVVIKLLSTTQGLRFNLSAAGIRVQLAN